MWVCTNKGFLSIVDKARTPGCLVVRARGTGHIEALFPEAAVSFTPGNDYLWRAEIPREEAARMLAEQVMNIEYSNFKDSVHDHALHDAYFKAWRAMADLQEIPPYSRAG